MKRTRNRLAGFTLIELLIVIAIISVLIGLLLPVLSHVRKQTWKTRMVDKVHQIESSWKGYLNDYREFPDLSITEMDPATVSILAGSNYRSAVYMEFTPNEMTNGMRDHWGSVFQLALDNGVPPRDTVGYDGAVEPFAGVVVEKFILVWSKGPDRSDLLGFQDDDLRNWKK